MRKFLKYILISLLILNKALAATCCSASATSGQIILGSAKSVFRLNYSHSSVIADANKSSVIIRSLNEVETLRTYRFSYSSFVDNFWQWGISVPLISKARYVLDHWQSHEQLGDVSVNVGYKILPEYKRNFIFSRAHIYFNYTFANAPSLYTSKRKDLLDTTGSGHEIAAVGISGIKRHRFGVANMQLQLSHRFSKKINSNNFLQQSVTTSSSNDLMSSITNSNDLYNFVISYGLSYNVVERTITSEDKSKFSTTTISLLKTFKDDYDFSLSYADDFLFNNNSNHFLSKSIAMQMLVRFN